MTEVKLCYWCHEPLPPLPENASYVDEINHYMHEECREERDDNNRHIEQLRGGIVEGSIDSIPDVIRQAVLARIKASGFSRRCPCLSRDAVGPSAATAPGGDPRTEDRDADGEPGSPLGSRRQDRSSRRETNRRRILDDYDERNSVRSCELCRGSGSYDPLPGLLELSDDKAAEAWIVQELPRSSGPCDHWMGFPEAGWYYDALGYNRTGKGPVRGVTVYNPDRMLGGVISWLEIANLFRPRVQSSLF